MCIFLVLFTQEGMFLNFTGPKKQTQFSRLYSLIKKTLQKIPLYVSLRIGKENLQDFEEVRRIILK